jgi:Pilus formation protein N terminal region
LLLKGNWGMNRKTWLYAALGVLALAAPLSLSLAQSAAPTVAAAEADDGTIRLTPDATKIVRLESDAASVIVANPAHASIVLDSPRLLIIMPRQPGTTRFTVLDAKGQVLLEKNIIVTATAQPSYVRIRRACADGTTCAPDSYYYCPDGCYEVAPVNAQGTAQQAPPVMSGKGGGPSIAEENAALEGAGSAVPPTGTSLGLPQVLPPTEPGGGVQVAPLSSPGPALSQ